MGSIFHQKGRVSEQVCIEKMVNFPPCLLAWTIERRRRRRGVAFIWWAKLNPISPSGFTTEYLRKRFPSYLLYLIYRSSKLSRYLPILNSRTDIYGSRPTYAIFPNFPIAVRRGFWIHFLYPRTRIPLSIRSQSFLNVLVKPSNTSRIFQLNTFRNFASFFREWKKKKKKNYLSSLQVFYYS